VITSVAFTTVNCVDQERAKTFYTEVLGFEPYRDEPMGESGAGRWIEVGPKGADTRLVLFPDADQAGGFASFVLDTDDIVATCADLAERGAEITAQPKVEAWGSWWAQIKDSEGNEIGLSQRRLIPEDR
jgi:predicted enzyme related to lactoylglutathione lyase